MPSCTVTPEQSHPEVNAGLVGLQVCTALDTSDGIDCDIRILSDLLQLALYECERQGRSADRIDSAIRAADRFISDISQGNKDIQATLAQIERAVTPAAGGDHA